MATVLHYLTKTLLGKTLIRLAAVGAAVILAGSIVGFYALYRQEENQVKSDLRAQVSERARVAEQLLSTTVETHRITRKAFIERWSTCLEKDIVQKFKVLMSEYPDGTWRNRPEISDGRLNSTGWIKEGTVLTDEIRCRIVLFYELSEKYGPGATLGSWNLFFMTVPEEGNMGYDPFITPDWIREIPPNFSQLDFEWGKLGLAPAKPNDPTVWSCPTVDTEIPEENKAFFTALTPIHVGQRHVGTVGTTMILSDFLSRVWSDGANDTRYVLFHRDGRLIADTSLGTALASRVGRVTLKEMATFEVELLRDAQSAGELPRARYHRAGDSYYAISSIEGPSWYVAAILPGALVRGRALGTALWAMAIGFATLGVLLFLHALVLRRHIARPLVGLITAAERLASGAQGVRLPGSHFDEVGKLAGAFNEMSEKIEQRDVALRQDRQQLQDALEELRLQEERWRGMTDNASDLIAVIDPMGIVTYISPPVKRLLGNPPEYYIGLSATALVHADDQPMLRSHSESAVAAPVRIRVLRADHTWIPVEVVASDQRHHPAVRGTVLNIRDIAEILRAEQRLREQSNTLHQTEKLVALGGLLAGVAHELNNPLAIVLGRASQLRDTTSNTSEREIAIRICAAAERCAKTVRTFLAMVRRQPVARVPVDINEIVADSVDVLAYTLDSSGIEVDLRLSKALPNVLADADQLGQVLLNLIVNAQQAMAGTSGARRITISTLLCNNNRAVRIEVLDTGPGVPEEIATRILDPFFTTKPTGEGTGVGLSICLGIVQSHDGSLNLVRRQGPGALFAITLPATNDVCGLGDEPFFTSDTRSIRIRALVVDDEIEIGRVLCDILEYAGHSATAVCRGSDALVRMSEEIFDVVLMDLKLPEMDGPQLYSEIVRRFPNMEKRVIAVTGDSLSSFATEFLSRSNVPIIEKPFSQADVLSKVQRLFE